jgi:hypothetical protein
LLASVAGRPPRGAKEDAMVDPASIEDWIMFAGAMGSLGALAAGGCRWMIGASGDPSTVTTPRSAR